MHRKGGGVFNSGFVSTNPETRCRSPNRLEVRIAEGDSVNVTAAVFTETADETDVGFAAGIGEAHGGDSPGANLLRERMPAPWRLRTRVCVSSEKTRPEVSVPRRTMGTCFEMRPLLRTPAIDGRPRAVMDIGKSVGMLYRRRWYRGTRAWGTRGSSEYRWN